MQQIAISVTLTLWWRKLCIYKENDVKGAEAKKNEVNGCIKTNSIEF